MALTRRQYQVLAFLDSFVRERGYCPSYDEVRKSMGLASLATVHKHLNTLEQKGFIHRDSNRSRSIEIINRQPMIEVAAVKEESSRESERFKVASSLPLLGRIAAGLPVETFVGNEKLFLKLLYYH